MTKTKLAQLTSSLLLSGRQWRKLAEAALARQGISEARAAALVWIRRLGGGLRQVQLAGHIGIEGTSLVRLLDQLCSAGLVERRDDPIDRRANTIWLTPVGEELAQRIEGILTELRERALHDIDQTEVEAALKVLDAIARANDSDPSEYLRQETVG